METMYLVNFDQKILLALFTSCLVAYLIGSIPFGLLLGKAFGVGDIRNIGSGNIGATNMMRTGKKGLALATFLLDFFKGTIGLVFAVCLQRLITGYWLTSFLFYLPAVCVVIGHIFPIWLRFKGGKGVATTLGVLLAMTPITFVVVALLWVVTFFITRYSSLSAILSIGLAPLVAIVSEKQIETFYIILILSIIVIVKHKDNIKRLANGTESKWSKKKS